MGRELLFLIDGFGYDTLSTYADVMPTMSRMVNFGKIQTAFPSTTATSLATLTTGELPGVHGMLGYTVQVPRSGGRILNSLKWDERVDPFMWQPIQTLFERAIKENINVTHVAAKRYENTGFTQAVFRGAKYSGANITTDLVSQTVSALQKTPSFVYLYVNDLDSAGHSDGIGSDKWIAALVAIDQLVASLLHSLPRGTRMWLTADHGMINVGEKIIIGQENDLAVDIAVIAGEPRARHLYLAPENNASTAVDEVAHRWREFLGDRAIIFTKDEAKAAHLFGEYVSDDASDRMGDVIAIAQGEIVLLEQERADKEGAMVGHHGGVTEAESTVPLLTTTIH